MSLSREEIIRMAREVGEAEGMELVFHPVIERLANAAYDAGAAATERELLNVCTTLLEAEAEQEDTMARGMLFGCAVEMAREAIRARRNGG